MSRTADVNLSNAKQRSKLPAQAEPHYDSIKPGRVLGYVRKGPQENGTWVVRVQIKDENGNRARRRETLGAADDLCVANGVDILSEDQARAKACAWQPQDAAKRAGGLTVADVCEQYKTFSGKKGNKSEKNKQKGFDILRSGVLRLESDGTPRSGRPGLGHLAVSALTKEILTDWRDALKAETSESSALRIWSGFHSALEVAYKKESNGIASNKAWRTVDLIDQSSLKGRQLHFSNEEAFAILAVARRLDQHVADYFDGLFYTGARPGGELWALQVSHFSAVNGNVEIQTRSDDFGAKTGTRIVWLDDDGVAFFKRLCKGRASTAPIFTRDGTEAWSHDSRRVKAVLVAAVQEVLGSAAPAADDKSLVPYAFRHTFISRRLESGQISTTMIADHCGTSEFMINKFYKKFCPAAIRNQLNASAPKRLRVVQQAA